MHKQKITAVVFMVLVGLFVSVGSGLAFHPNVIWAFPSYGYTYGPAINYDFIAASVFRNDFDTKLYPYRHLGCPVLCIGDYLRKQLRRRPVEIIRGNRIVVR